MTIKRKSFSDDFSKSYNLYTITATDEENINKPNEDENSEFIYLTVPAEYRCVYNKLLLLLSELGVDMINDCQAVCGGKNKFIITCWNMFQAACAAYSLGETKKAELLINYIKAQLQLGCEKEKVYYTITLNINNDTAGSVIGAGVYEEGAVITIKAIPNTGYEFDGWDDGINDEVREIIVDKDIELTAKFTELIYTITVSSTGKGSVSGGGDFKYGQRITITAIPDANSKFVKWSDGNTDNNRIITITEDKTYVAIFEDVIVNEILFGNTSDYSAQEFNNLSIAEIVNLVDSTIKIEGNSVNTKTINQTNRIHFLLVPTDLIELINVYYISSGITNPLWDNETESGLYKGIDKIEEYNGIKYRLFFNPIGGDSLKPDIILKAKNR